MIPQDVLTSRYLSAKAIYATFGIDTEKIINELSDIPISLNCWQADDVRGFERKTMTGGGISATGNYPGAARSIEDVQKDAEFAFKFMPGRKKFNLHAIYGNFPENHDRNNIEPEHFEIWVNWAKNLGIGLDFNPTLFSHKKAKNNLTLCHPNHSIRQYWIDHVKKSRNIAAWMGNQLKKICINNLWIPDGTKDVPINRYRYRERLLNSLEEIYAEDIQSEFFKDAVEGKLFGLGIESFTAGSHEFYSNYTSIHPQILLCLDMGHFHPTESVADKISAHLVFEKEILLHISRGVRWDSDHVPIFDESLQNVMQEVVRSGKMNKIYFALDFFDATIHRVAAWIIGFRSAQKALLYAMLDPIKMLTEYEENLDFTRKLAVLEELKTLPFIDIWNYYCVTHNVPIGKSWLEELKKYEKNVTSLRK
ncbi:MAG: L-rhamnose isomerase [Candidatus Lokiarchaeota archaeon]|nr:L-rhamnose isomerase [Candidatus Lokiarchaeota archaeon]